VVNATPAAAGEVAILSVTLSNTGDTDLQGLRLVPLDPVPLDGPDASPLVLTGLAAGSSVAVEWSVTASQPVDAWLAGRLLMFQGDATDPTGGQSPSP
jgi:hypothetical protein